MSSCNRGRLEVFRKDARLETTGLQEECGLERATDDVGCSEVDAEEEEGRRNDGDSGGYDVDDDVECANDDVRVEHDGDHHEGHRKAVGRRQHKGEYKLGGNVCDVTDDDTNRSDENNESQGSNLFVEDEAEEVNNAQVEAEDAALATESSRSEESSHSGETLWKSDATNDDPRDVDYDADGASEHPTDDDAGVPIMVIDDSAVGGDEVTA